MPGKPEMSGKIVIEPVTGARGRGQFVDLGRSFAAREPHSVPQLRSEQMELIDPAKNPFFGHARAQLFLARRGGDLVGRISAPIAELALAMRSAERRVGKECVSTFRTRRAPDQ